MRDCPFLAGCPLFERTLADQPVVASVYRRLYCQGTVDACARLLVRENLGETRVPVSLFPYETTRARALIRRG